MKRFNDFVKILKTQTTFLNLKWVMIDQKKFKVFLSTGNRAGRYSWSYPFIDIFFFDEGQTMINRKIRKKLVSTPKADIFPLKLRPFGKYWLPTPSKPANYLKRFGNYRDICARGDWSHRQETKQENFNTTCSMLSPHFRFVSINCFKASSNEICIEMTAIKDKSIVYLVYNQSQPMTLRLDF